MKLCDVVQFYSPLGGGVRRYLEDKMRYLSERPEIAHTVIVPSHRNAVVTNLESKMFEVRSLRLIGSISYRMLLNRPRMLSIIDQERPDLIEVGDPYRSAWITLEAAQRHRIPVAAFYHSDFPRALGRTIRRFCSPAIERMLSNAVQRYIVNLYNRMSVTVVASRHLQRVLMDCGIQRVVCIPLGTNVSVFAPNPGGVEIRKNLGIAANDVLLLYVGRLAREKNIRSLVGMMDELDRQPIAHRPVHLLMVGDGELREYVKKEVAQRRNILWHQYCTSSEALTAYYSAADLYVHAGTYETFGITSLEAQACGTRVLAVRGGGLDESVMGEPNSVMADSSNPADLARGVLQSMRVEPFASKEDRRQRIVNRFSIQMTFHRLFALYEHILEKRPVDEYVYPDESLQEDEYRYSTLLTR